MRQIIRNRRLEQRTPITQNPYTYGLLGFGLIIIVTLFYLGREDTATEQSTEQLIRTNQAATDSVTVSSSLDVPSAQKVSQAMARRRELIKQSPDDYYDPKNKNATYRRKVRYHQAIRTFQLSSRYEDPEFRKIMILLLEHGYGPEEWFRVVNVLRSTMTPAMLHKEKLESEGFSEFEIDQELARLDSGWAIHKRALDHGGPQRLIAASARINERELIEELVKINFLKLGIRTNENLLSQEGQFLSPGERLLTDDDWMDDEMRKAQSHYQGEPKSDFDDRFDIFLKQGAIPHHRKNGEPER